METGRTLTAILVGLAVIGILGAAIPFLRSMEPSAKAIAALPRVKITGLNVGSYRSQVSSEKYADTSGWTWKVLLYRKSETTIKAWRIPTRNGAVGMPDLHWWRPFFKCEEFGPTLVNGVVDESLPIKCHDESASDFWRNEWKWDIDGKNLGTMVDDLNSIDGTIEGEFFVFSGRS